MSRKRKFNAEVEIDSAQVLTFSEVGTFNENILKIICIFQNNTAAAEEGNVLLDAAADADASLQATMKELEEIAPLIKKAEESIEAVEIQLQGAAVTDFETIKYLREKEQSLRDEKQSLRDEKQSLRDEKQRLRDEKQRKEQSLRDEKQRKDPLNQIALAQVDSELYRRVAALELSRTVHGITSAANHATSLEDQSKIMHNSPSLAIFLEGSKVNWWIDGQSPYFPIPGDQEKEVCQPFVTRIIENIKAVISTKIVRPPAAHPTATKEFKNGEKRSALVFHSDIEDCHKVASFAGRKPDMVTFVTSKRGPCQITTLGDVKGAHARQTEFGMEDRGKIFDFAEALLTKAQFTRTFVYCYLTDGFKFQFFKCNCIRMGIIDFSFEQSAVYQGIQGWQVIFLDNFLFNC